METIHFRAMNTEVLLVAEGNPDELAGGFEHARRYVEASEARFSRFLEASELSALNRQAGSWFPASPELFTVVSLSHQYYHRTRGLFDPSILPDLRRVGYDRSMDLLREGSVTPLLESMANLKRPSFSEMELDESGQRILLPAGMALDLGGIAKGWIAEQTALLLSSYSPACAVDAGGDMFLIGLPRGKSSWPVGLEDPLQIGTVLTTLRIDPGAIVTSSITKRTWKQGQKQRHHLIDPRKGEPAVTEWLSVTVIAPHAALAEVFAKALLIAGPQDAEQVRREAGTQLTYLAVDRERRIWGNPVRTEVADVSIQPIPA
jgi:thiamine biosynthesis lipoprotein